MIDAKVGFVGSGQMARALAAGFVRAGLLRGEQITAFDPVGEAVSRCCESVPGASQAASNSDVVQLSDVVFLAVKPQSIAEATAACCEAVSRDKLFVSIVAGVTISKLSEYLGTHRLVRVMPNTPCLVGYGASAYSLGADALEKDGELVGSLLQSVGVAFQVEEKLLDAVTGLSGSGPAYVFTMIEALSDGGVRMGLPRAIATTLAAQTVRGAAEMVISSAEHPAVLAERVTSPGGTTIAGLQVLEEHALRGALIAAIEAATERSIELGGQE